MLALRTSQAVLTLLAATVAALGAAGVARGIWGWAPAAALLLTAVGAASWALARRHARAWRAAGEACGLAPARGDAGWAWLPLCRPMEGAWRGRPARLAQRPAWWFWRLALWGPPNLGGPWTVVSIEVEGSHRRFRLEARRWTAVRRALGLAGKDHVPTGRAEFDAEVHVRANDAARALGVLDPALQEALRDALRVDRRAVVQCAPGRVFHVVRTRGALDGDRLRSRLDLLARVAEALARTARPPMQAPERC